MADRKLTADERLAALLAEFNARQRRQSEVVAELEAAARLAIQHLEQARILHVQAIARTQDIKQRLRASRRRTRKKP